ncbi:CidA/LrgA family protein [Acidisoma sp.]|uniref:CidA/LrgA family protein n=1 Tax=Acidisoma sp. TaxID=1872115 RepID=UPI003B002B78
MLQGFFILLACQLVGESMARGLHVPIPGPVLGIMLLLILLAVRGWQTGDDPARPDTALGFASDGLLRNLGLLFVPAGVGIVQSFHLVLANGVAVILALLGSSLITMVVTVSVFRLVSRAVAGRAGA